MPLAIRPYATVGVAIVGAGLVAVTPVAAPLPGMHSVIDVGLAADSSPLGDLLDPWLQVFGTATDNVNTLTQSFYLAPGVAFQQLMANLSGYAQQVIDDPANLTQVTSEMQENWKAAMSAITLMNANQDTVDAVVHHTMDGTLTGGHATMFGQIAGYLPPDQADSIMPIINFLASPWGGVIMGALGPGISPWVALLNSITEGDSFGQIMASPLNGLLNGATLDLSALTPMINGLGLFPGNMAMTHLDIAFGGLLSPGGNVQVNPYNVVDDAGNSVGDAPAVGGSIFNSVGITFTGVPVINTLQLDSDPVGPLGAGLGLDQVIASQLGWGTWNGKAGPYDVPAMPPGTDIDFSTNFDEWFSDFFPAD
ncbi:outer membrane porin GjpA [Mycobacterium sp. SMC-15]|uniref:outer membrane porin GjpA n=1 Tax=Mycobacterium sp. SMC-15 TaxID=3381627 RepID=UPI00387730DE